MVVTDIIDCKNKIQTDYNKNYCFVVYPEIKQKISKIMRKCRKRQSFKDKQRHKR